MCFVKTLLFILAIVISTYTNAVALYQSFSSVSNYNSLIDVIGPGDEVRTSQRSFKVVKRLDRDEAGNGSGAFTAVFLVDTGQVIRLPLMILNTCHAISMFPSGDSGLGLDGSMGVGMGAEADFGRPALSAAKKDCKHVELFKGYYNGYKTLFESGIPVVQIDEGQTDMPEVIVVEYLGDSFFTVEDFINNDSLSGKDRAYYWEKLEALLFSTWEFAEIGDFKWEHIGWAGSEFKIFDWTNEHKKYSESDRLKSLTVIDRLRIPEDLRAKLKSVKERILNKRNECINLLNP